VRKQEIRAVCGTFVERQSLGSPRRKLRLITKELIDCESK
jgi:hypothetical protein